MHNAFDNIEVERVRADDGKVGGEEVWQRNRLRMAAKVSQIKCEREREKPNAGKGRGSKGEATKP